MDLGTDAGRDTGPVWDARPPAPRPGPPWRPWWVIHSSWSRVWFNCGLATLWTVIGVSNLHSKHRASDVAYLALIGLWWLINISGAVILWRRPDIARLPARPSTRPAIIVTALAGITLAAGVVSFLALISAHPLNAGFVGVGVVAASVVLGRIAHWLNRRPTSAPADEAVRPHPEGG